MTSSNVPASSSYELVTVVPSKDAETVLVYGEPETRMSASGNTVVGSKIILTPLVCRMTRTLNHAPPPDFTVLKLCIMPTPFRQSISLAPDDGHIIDIDIAVPLGTVGPNGDARSADGRASTSHTGTVDDHGFSGTTIQVGASDKSTSHAQSIITIICRCDETAFRSKVYTVGRDSISTSGLICLERRNTDFVSLFQQSGQLHAIDIGRLPFKDIFCGSSRIAGVDPSIRLFTDHRITPFSGSRDRRDADIHCEIGCRHSIALEGQAVRSLPRTPTPSLPVCFHAGLRRHRHDDLLGLISQHSAACDGLRLLRAVPRACCECHGLGSRLDRIDIVLRSRMPLIGRGVDRKIMKFGTSK